MHEGVAIGDEVKIGAESVIMQGVRIYPYKEVETGSHIFESLIWESRGTTRVRADTINRKHARKVPYTAPQRGAGWEQVCWPCSRRKRAQRAGNAL